jgi:hypothetical protein
MIACSTTLTCLASQSAALVCAELTDLDAAFKRVMEKLDRIEALIDALPSSRADSMQVAAAGDQSGIS